METIPRPGSASPLTRHAGRPLRRTLAAALTALGLAGLLAAPAAASPLPDTIERVTPSVVGLGTYAPTRSPRLDFHGTGFIVADGRAVLTNSHVIPPKGELDLEARERYVALVGDPGDPALRSFEVFERLPDSDLALLRLEGDPLPALTLGTPGDLRIGHPVAYTGFPIGMIVGFYPVTHTAHIAARTPMALPARRDSELDAAQIRRLRHRDPPMVFQLDGTAYPGNSGSPVYDVETGAVKAVLNKVFVQGGREAAIAEPSGISYAIPVDLADPLLERYRQHHGG